jgi:hypothetical protein
MDACRPHAIRGEGEIGVQETVDANVKIQAVVVCSRSQRDPQPACCLATGLLLPWPRCCSQCRPHPRFAGPRASANPLSRTRSRGTAPIRLRFWASLPLLLSTTATRSGSRLALQDHAADGNEDWRLRRKGGGDNGGAALRHVDDRNERVLRGYE